MVSLLVAMAVGAAHPSAVSAGSLNPDYETRSVTVHYGDLDLASRGGRAELDRRVRTAINSVCREPGRPTIEERKAAGDCIDRATRDTDEAVEVATAQASHSVGRG